MVEEPAPQRKERKIMSRVTVKVEPVLALVAGLLVLFMPALLNYIVAVYLIVVGVLGLMDMR
jgi:uncharacterized membrane protein HdeD (DUF308 family)